MRQHLVLVLFFAGSACAAKAPLYAATVDENGPESVSRAKQYRTVAARPELYSDDVINVHVVPHTHDDVGWLKTVDQYYIGSNNSIQHAGVQYVLDSAIAQLQKDPNRRFTYVEMAFFARWFYDQNAETQDIVRGLVANGQLDFVNGGWCMHDEASTHYVAMVDQTTLGHQFLAKEFDGFCPRVGWQIDPFGHSSTQASLLSWGAGFDALFFGRIDYQDRELRRDNKQCEGVWRASPSLGDDAEVFWGLTGSYGGNYGAPDGFCFDSFCDEAVPVQDDTYLHDYNVDARVADFVDQAVAQAKMTQGNHIMFTMGSDFQYESASEWFSNLDKLIHYTNADEAASKVVNVFYSTPTMYTEAKNAEQATYIADNPKEQGGKETTGITWEVKTDDFFPYADSAHAYWTGYFTSRTELKRYERITSGQLQVFRQLEALSGQGVGEDGSKARDPYPVPSAMYQSGVKPGGNPPEPFMGSPLGVLQAASGVNQHHDAVSGTAKQHVTYDYAQRLAEGVNQAADMVAAALDILTGGSSKKKAPASSSSSSTALAQCALLNVSVCAATQEVGDGGAVAVVAYNPLARSRGEVLLLPVARSPSSVVDGDTGAEIPFQVMEAAWSPDPDAAPLTLAFSTGPLDPLSAKQMVIFFDADDEGSAAHVIRPESVKRLSTAAPRGSSATFEVTNGPVTLTFSNSTGLLVGMAYANDGEDAGLDVAAVDLEQSFGYYTSFSGGLEGLDLGECDPSTWEGCPEATVAELEKRKYRRHEPRSEEAIRLHQLKHALNPVELHTSNKHHHRKRVGSFDDESQNSGAYIFRPEVPDQSPVSVAKTVESIEVLAGPIVTEVRQRFAPWVNQTVRLVAGQHHAALEFTVGPVPIEDGKGKEVITRFSSSVNNLADPSDEATAQIYTDSNGREFLQRTYNVRETWDLENAEPVAGNYYPMNAAAYIRDTEAQLSVLTDRSQGVASLSGGQLEVMIQRRLLADDSRGVGEPLNETTGGVTSYADTECSACREGRGVIVRGTHVLQLHKPAYAMKHLRSDADRIFLPVFAAFDSARDGSKLRRPEHHQQQPLPARAAAVRAMAQDRQLSTAVEALPANVKLLTLQAVNASSLLLRLEHSFAVGEDETLSQPAIVNVSAFLGSLGFAVAGAVELTLTANQPLEDLSRLHWNTESALSSRGGGGDVSKSVTAHVSRKRAAARRQAAELSRSLSGVGDGVVTLEPQEIRTALVTLEESLETVAMKRLAAAHERTA